MPEAVAPARRGAAVRARAVAADLAAVAQAVQWRGVEGVAETARWAIELEG